jgi:hypothetical protein
MQRDVGCELSKSTRFFNDDAKTLTDICNITQVAIDLVRVYIDRANNAYVPSAAQKLNHQAPHGTHAVL